MCLGLKSTWPWLAIVFDLLLFLSSYGMAVNSPNLMHPTAKASQAFFSALSPCHASLSSGFSVFLLPPSFVHMATWTMERLPQIPKEDTDNLMPILRLLNV